MGGSLRTPLATKLGIGPGGASGVTSEIGVVGARAAILATGLVDNKIGAIDEVWSGLRAVRRLIDRPSTPTTPERRQAGIVGAGKRR